MVRVEYMPIFYEKFGSLRLLGTLFGFIFVFNLEAQLFRKFFDGCNPLTSCFPILGRTDSHFVLMENA